MSILHIISISSIIFIVACSTKPKYQDDPDFWIYELEDYKKDTFSNIDNIISIYKKTNNDLVKMYAIALLQDHIENNKVSELLMAELENESKHVCIEIIKAFSKPGLNFVTNKFIELLYKNVESEVKIEICNGLGKIGDKRAIPPLIDMLNSKDDFLILSCSYALHIITKYPLKEGKTIKSPKEWLNIISEK